VEKINKLQVKKKKTYDTGAIEGMMYDSTFKYGRMVAIKFCCQDEFRTGIR
jgi:hypothetical protein